MPIELFGISIGRAKKEALASQTPIEKKATSFVLPELDDAMPVDAGGYYGIGIDLDGSLRNEAQFISKYREMAMQPEIEQAVEDICNESIVNTNEKRFPVGISLEHTKLSDAQKESIEKEFNYIMRLLDFNNRGYEIFRRWYVDGKGYYHMIVNPNQPRRGIIEMRPIDAAKIKKIAKVEKDVDPKTGAKTIKGVKEVYIYREKPNESSAIEIAPEAINYYPSGLYDPSRTRSVSYLQKAIKPMNQLRMVEDATVIYRLSRAPERRIFYVDVGSLPKNKAEQYVKGLMNRYRNKLVYDANTGEIRDDRKFMNMLEDYWFPRREGGKGTEVSTLDGGQNLGEMDDVMYFEKKLYKALNIPLSRMETDTGFNMGRASEITRDELNFVKFIERLRNKFALLFTNALRVQCLLKGILKDDEWYRIQQDIRFEFASDSYFTESKENEVLQERLNILRDINDHIGDYYSREYVRRNILRQTDSEMKEIDKQISFERENGLLPDKSESMGF
jgi:hypothetical protein|tara:strand:- start:837 stop:2348 length:1512 start_codon:yes stop_codon:yes gene_type:complete